MIDKLFDSSVQVLEKSLDLHSMRHAITADNIANAETPGFKARRIDFEQDLQNAVQSEAEGLEGASIEGIRPKIYQEFDSEMGQDLNTVDMDKEMALMSKNDIQYSAATQMISRKFSMLKYAVTEGADK